MSELELLVDLYRGTERQGPGSVGDTLMALEMIDLPKDENLQIADIGCGTGSQTITLARHTAGHITAIDLMSVFLEQLNINLEKKGLLDRVETVEASMEALPFTKQSLDIMWSEGAIYNIGFAKGISYWKDYLKPNGFLSVSEITWTTNDRPKEIEEYWQMYYPEIDTAPNKIRVLEVHGFSPVGYFILSPDSWIDNYYKPLEAGFSQFLNRHKHSGAAAQIVEEHKAEIEMYMQNKDYFSYGFYIAKKL